MEAAAERCQSASTDGCLLSSNYTDDGSFSHLRLRLSADEDVQGGFTSLIDKWTGLNKQRHAVTQVSRLLDKNLPADVLFLHTDTNEKNNNKVGFWNISAFYYRDWLCLKIQFILQVKSQVHDVHLNERAEYVEKAWMMFLWHFKRKKNLIKEKFSWINVNLFNSDHQLK